LYKTWKRREDAPEELDDPPEAELVADGSVHESNLEAVWVVSSPPDEDDVVVVRPIDDRPVSPPSELSLVIASYCVSLLFISSCVGVEASMVRPRGGAYEERRPDGGVLMPTVLHEFSELGRSNRCGLVVGFLVEDRPRAISNDRHSHRRRANMLHVQERHQSAMPDAYAQHKLQHSDRHDRVPQTKVGLLARRQLPQDDAKAVDVGEHVVDILLVKDLGRHPVDAALHLLLAAPAALHLLLELGQPEVADL
jgi:hypothetical protein